MYRRGMFVFCLGTICAWGQLRVTAVVNGASFQTPVAPGSFASSFGENLGTLSAVTPANSWPATLAGVSLTVNGRSAPLHSVTSTANGFQINFQVPRDTPTGSATVVVNSGASASAPFTFQVAAAAPGILTYATNHAVAQHLDGSVNAPDHPVLPGGAIVLYMTGQGAVDHPVDDGKPSPGDPLARAALPATATIGGRDAHIFFLGLTPNFVGLLQANITVPPDLPAGNYPIIVTINGVASNGPMLTVGSVVSQILTPLGSADTGSGNKNVVVQGDLAYVCGDSGINVVDVANPSAPRLLTLVPGQFGRCRPSGRNLIAVSGANPAAISVFNLDNPRQPVRVGGPLTSPRPFVGDFLLPGDTGFFTTLWFEFLQNPCCRITRQHGDLFSVSFTDPARPAVLNTLSRDPAQPATTNESPYFGQMGLSSTTMLLLSTTATGENTNAGLGRIVVVDIGDRNNLRALNQVVVPRTVALRSGAGIQGSNALIVGSTSSWTSPGDLAVRGNVTLTTVDLANPRDPRPIATVVTSELNNFTAPACAPLGNGFVGVAAWSPPEEQKENRILILDARDPNNPNVVGAVTLKDLTELGLYVLGDKLYAATASGLTVFQIRTP